MVKFIPKQGESVDSRNPLKKFQSQIDEESFQQGSLRTLTISRTVSP